MSEFNFPTLVSEVCTKSFETNAIGLIIIFGPTERHIDFEYDSINGFPVKPRNWETRKMDQKQTFNVTVPINHEREAL